MDDSFLQDWAKQVRQVRVHVRWLIRRDMNEVCEMEILACEDSWGYQNIVKKLRQKNCIGMVAEAGEKVVGYMLYDIHFRDVGLLRLVVHPDWQRRAVGSQMVEKLKSRLSRCRRNRITVEVPDHLLSAHLFLRSQGFVATGVDGDLYCFEGGEG
jgi:ribosomal-protein-alanine N-acetyltransferase